LGHDEFAKAVTEHADYFSLAPILAGNAKSGGNGKSVQSWRTITNPSAREVPDSQTKKTARGDERTPSHASYVKTIAIRAGAHVATGVAAFVNASEAHC
jgi:hypothetical protein